MTTPTPPRMTYSPEDFPSYNELATAPDDYRPQIDARTRQILKALMHDLVKHSAAATNQQTDPDTWLSIQVPINVLNVVLSEEIPLSAARAVYLACEDAPRSHATKPSEPPAPFLYNDGDIARALTEGLSHAVSADDIEAALYSLLFERDDESTHAARELLADLLHANEGKK